jgi:hypothetical protein
LFASLDPAALDEVTAAARVRHVEAGSTFSGEGDQANAFFVLSVGQ